MQDEQWIEEALQELVSAGLERKISVQEILAGDGVRAPLNFASNDYLNLSHHPAVIEALVGAASAAGSSPCSSRLLAGTFSTHQSLEEEIAAFVGYPAALVFGAGYLANVGLLSAVAGREDMIIADKLVHASLVDGARLSRAEFVRFRHNDLDHLEGLLKREESGGRGKRRRFIVTESVFSMDGDLAPLEELARLAERFGAFLIVDEAHALGVFGENGRGRLLNEGLTKKVSFFTGTLSKAFGSYGGFVAASSSAIRLLVNRARTFIFNTALPVPSARGAQAALRLIKETPGFGAQLLRRADTFRNQLRDAGLPVMIGESQIIPLLIGENDQAVRVSRKLFERGIVAPAVRPPTVPPGTARLRLSVTLAHDSQRLAQSVEVLRSVFQEEKLLR